MINALGPRPVTVNLSVRGGDRWRVSIIDTDDGVRFDEGFVDFVKRYQLIVGDQLVFMFDMESDFDVNLFDFEGLEKRNTGLPYPSDIDDNWLAGYDSDNLRYALEGGGVSSGTVFWGLFIAVSAQFMYLCVCADVVFTCSC